MKTLYLLRHAKSSWEDPDLKDFERPLSDRGRGDVPVMAERFLARDCKLTTIISSPATRAKTTASLFAKSIHLSQDELASNPELYFAGAAMFLKATQLLDEENEAAMLVGHNPAITEFVNCLANSDIDNVPTCGLVEIRLPQNNWADVNYGSGELVNFDYPKRV